MALDLTVTVEVVIPEVPDHLVTSSGMKLPLDAVEEYGLRQIAELWTDALMEKRREAVRTQRSASGADSSPELSADPQPEVPAVAPPPTPEDDYPF